MDTPKRYHPVLVTLHWLVALLVFLDLYIGYFYIRPIILSGGGGVRGTDAMLKIHMAAGIAILVLIVARFVIRLSTRKPVPADAGFKILNVLARAVHYALYFFVFAMTIVGLVFALQTNRLQAAFLGATGGPGFGPGSGFSRPGSGPSGAFPAPGAGTPAPNFSRNGAPAFPPGSGPRPAGRRGFNLFLFLLPLHLYLSIVLIALLTLHILAACYHQLVRRDHLLRRMWYGPA
ncbi:MAG TPA: cytochrome b/b6 domain-containing protein [Anaerolineales bacterium]|nr:cytochrome b/b6 domain-containing protein [Anaerolineales bacterium]